MGHGEVRDDHVRAKPLRRFDELLTVANGANHVEARVFQDPREAVGHDIV